MDKLSKMAAEAAKRGMSYGKYIAMTRQEDRPAEETKDNRKKYWSTCQCCGAQFFRYDKLKQRYCGEACRNRVNNAAHRARKAARQEAECKIKNGSRQE